MPLLRQTLGELRRYHRLLMIGGRCAAVLVMIVALLADVTLLVRTYIDDEREMFTIAHRLVRGRVAANERLVRLAFWRHDCRCGCRWRPLTGPRRRHTKTCGWCAR